MQPRLANGLYSDSQSNNKHANKCNQEIDSILQEGGK